MTHEHTDCAHESAFRTPWGDGRLVVEGDRPVLIELPLPEGPLPDASSLPCPRVRPAPGSSLSSSARGTDALLAWVRELEDFFISGPRNWTAEELGLDRLPVSAFARDVYRALLAIPPGETVSYGELATLAGHPGAARAVGTAMASNPLALVIPCHRVIRSDGSSGRYGRCDSLKPFLLSLEGAS